MSPTDDLVPMLKKLRLSDSEQFTVAPAPDMHGAAWLPDGRIVLGGTINNDYALSIVSAEGGKPELLLRPDKAHGEEYLVYPSALPDGDGVIFHSAGGAGAPVSTNVLELSTRRRTKLMDGGGAAVALPEGALVYAEGGSLFVRRFALAFGLRHTLSPGDSTRLAKTVRVASDTSVSRSTFEFSKGTPL